ncbi:MAG: MlaD family protein [Planctomycetota bacterium]|nr:MlaD family protein [Planctomycetota bacterium]
MTTESPAQAHPEAVVRKRKGIQTVWIVPIVAALVGGWLWFKAMEDKGPTITITFKTAEGLEAGKTKIKYKDLQVGQVSDISLDASLQYVVVKAELDPDAKEYMVDQTRFWVVKPRIGAEGISGLSTIISGSYIAADISSEGAPTKTFTGLEEPPSRPTDSKGLRIKLRADSLKSISQGTQVTHLQIKMGDVDSYKYLEKEELIEFELYIEPQWADLVRKNTRFWSTSGFDVTLSAEGFDLHVESLESILTGGVAFGATPGEPKGPPAENGDIFTLLPSEAASKEINTDPQRTIAYFHESVRGLKVGSSVTFQGIEIGKVLSVEVELDAPQASFRVPVIMETYTSRLVMKEIDTEKPFNERLKMMVDQGLRAQLSHANLITGARGITVEFRKNSPAKFYADSNGLPEIPTVPSTGEALNEMITELPVIVKDFGKAVKSVTSVVDSAETKSILASLHSAADSLKTVMDEVSVNTDPLLTSGRKALGDLQVLLDNVNKVADNLGKSTPQLMTTIQETANAANTMLKNGDKSLASITAGLPLIEQQLVKALREIASGMSAVKDLADYLERHPDALIMGKHNSGGQ